MEGRVVVATHVLEGAVTFLNVHEATTLDAMVARIIPGSPEDPGAREAGVLRYIDRALEGPYRDLRPLYRQGLAALDDECLAKHGRGFAELDEPAQDQLLGRLAETEPAEQLVAGEAGEARTEEAPQAGQLAYFFAVVRQHVLEGMFGDPAYGGNKDGVGWRLIGFPGARWGYDEDEMRYGFDAAQLPITTLEDLRRQRAAANAGRESS
jgi:gluconate 2-dehydrogenase gamma chain